MNRHCIFCFIVFLLFSCNAFAQAEVDSLEKLIKTQKGKNLAKTYNNLSRLYIRIDPNKVIEYGEQALKLSQKYKVTESEIKANNNIGIGNAILGNYDKSVVSFKKSLRLAKKIKDSSGIAYALDNLGNVYIYQSKYKEALDVKQKALTLKEKLEDEAGIITSLLNMATLFDIMQAHDKAISMYKKACRMARKSGRLRDAQTGYENIAVAYYSQKKYDTSRLYIDTILELNKQFNDPHSEAFCYGLIAGMARNDKDYQKAIEYYLKELSLTENSGDAESLCNAYNNLGKTYSDVMEFQKAEFYLLKGLKIAEEIGAVQRIYEAFHGLGTVYENTGKYRDAATYYSSYIKLKDSVMNENINKQIAEMEAKFNDEKTQLENVNLKKQQALDKAENEKKDALVSEEKSKKRFLTIGLGLSGLLLALSVYGFLQKRKDNKIIHIQKKEVEIQKQVVEEKNKEITDSIKYAKRIQEAILPPVKLVKENLPDSFILYKPKDIVAGDFYWMENLKTTFEGKTRSLILFAAADCTGHGVPGAMVSVMGFNALNRSVREFNLLYPNEILDKTNELLKENFIRSEKNVNDGMDIALCNLDIENREIWYAGAHNSLWLIRNNSDEIEEVKADKQPIGNFDYQKPFNCHKISLNKGDRFYVFSDGYSDQFGGPGGKKFKQSQFRKIILEIKNEPMENQRKKLDQTIEEWKGQLEQNDDITIIGVKIT